MTVVRAAAGAVDGAERDGVHAFLGIPYALAPFGERRFRAPERRPPWVGVRPATEFGPSVPQIDPSAPDTVSGFESILRPFATVEPPGEDCLNLNVWTPEPTKAALPVFVWVHGGGFVIGAGSDPIYDGSAFARDGVVCVTSRALTCTPLSPASTGVRDL